MLDIIRKFEMCMMENARQSFFTIAVNLILLLLFNYMFNACNLRKRNKNCSMYDIWSEPKFISVAKRPKI